jgi:predicted acyltransferase
MQTAAPSTPPRALSLDALRGYAIVTMTLAGSIASGILPAWMYHAQTPPPAHAFDPSVYGITWVDLVFPFFLFAMGAALPFSLARRMEAGVASWKLAGAGVLRGLRLAAFAIFVQHMYPYVLSQPQDARAWLTSLAAFATLFPMFLRLPQRLPKAVRYAVEAAGYGMALFLLLSVEYANGRTFNPAFSNIIIMVLAHMAVFGAVVYLATAHRRRARVLLLPFIAALLIGGVTNPDSWNAWVYQYTPFPWLYSFRYLKYLLIVIPGIIAGDYLRQWMLDYRPAAALDVKKERQTAIGLLFLTVALIVLNLYGLFTRCLLANLVATAGLLAAGSYIVRRTATSCTLLWKKLFAAGAYFLLLGLFLEACEGGIRKDHATFSYYFVTSGLAFMALIAFSILCDYFRCRKSTSFLVMTGQNPMIAYVASSLVVLPLLHLTRLLPLIDACCRTLWMGFLRGVLITALATLLTMFFTKIKWFWRT